MLRLLGYEIQRKWKLYIIILIGYAILNTVFALRQKALLGDLTFDSMDSVNALLDVPPTYVILIILLASFLALLALIDAVNLVRLEVKNPTRDLYFSIPLHAAKKLGTKYIIAVLQICFASIIGFFGVMLGIQIFTGFNILEMLFVTLDGQFLNILFFSLFSIIAVAHIIGIIYLTFSVYRSFFGQFRFGAIITIVLFGIIMYLYNLFLDPIMSVAFDNFNVNIWQSYGLSLLIMVAILAGIFTVTSYLFEKRINLD